MQKVTVFTADRMLKIENSTVVTGNVNDSGHLILASRDGTPIDAGSVVGPTGSKGDKGDKGDTGPAGAAVPADDSLTTAMHKDGSITYKKLASGVIVPANNPSDEFLITAFPDGWANYGSDSGGQYSQMRVVRGSSKICTLMGMIKATKAMTATAAVASANTAFPSWGVPRENALNFFGTSKGVFIRVAANANGTWGIYANGNAVDQNNYFAFSLTYLAA